MRCELERERVAKGGEGTSRDGAGKKDEPDEGKEEEKDVTEKKGYHEQQ
jgi:hypothetical protein